MARKPHVDGKKWCSHCETYLPLDRFANAKTNWDGLQYHCRDCWKKFYREKARPNIVFEKYGLTMNEYSALMEADCAICGADSANLDHDHSNGKVRAALCQQCNSMLGMAKDIPETLRVGADYLETHRG